MNETFSTLESTTNINNNTISFALFYLIYVLTVLGLINLTKSLLINIVPFTKRKLVLQKLKKYDGYIIANSEKITNLYNEIPSNQVLNFNNAKDLQPLYEILKDYVYEEDLKIAINNVKNLKVCMTPLKT